MNHSIDLDRKSLFSLATEDVTLVTCNARFVCYLRGMKRALILSIALGMSSLLYAQGFDYSVDLKPLEEADLPGLHSYSFGIHENEWLIVGGRLDGIHARQPFNAFPASSNNTDLIVFNPVTLQKWTASTSSLSSSIFEQLQSTNMCFHQVEDTLYIVGGYAYSGSANDHITFPYLTTLEVSSVIDAIKAGGDYTEHVRQVMDDRMAVTGGHLAYLDGDFMIVGGHRFDGRYNPMGHNTYTQSYTNSIRTFKIEVGTTPVITDYSESIDATHLHRRDYNLLPQIFGDGEFGYMISSGVFQTNVDLPYLYPVEIRPDGHDPITSFNQYLSNYHSAHVTLYDTNAQSSHSLLFGGMAQFYYDDTVLVEDIDVPFVNTISRLTRTSLDELGEYAMGTDMPALVGASAEFIIHPERTTLHDEIVVVENTDSSLIGYIYGGIESSSENPFTTNSTSQTDASPVVYEVWLKKTTPPLTAKVLSKPVFRSEVYPNPSNSGAVQVRLKVPISGHLDINILDSKGALIRTLSKGYLSQGKQDFDLIQAEELSKGSYTIQFSMQNESLGSSILIIE